MASNNRFFEDAARLAEGAMGSFVGLKREVETMVQAQFERLLAGMDLVRRDEFDAAYDESEATEVAECNDVFALATLRGIRGRLERLGARTLGVRRALSNPQWAENAKNPLYDTLTFMQSTRLSPDN